MVNKFPTIQCPVTGSLCSDCFKECYRRKQRNEEDSAEMARIEREGKEHRDDAKILQIIAKAVAEFHMRCNWSAEQAVAILPPPPPPLTPVEAQMHVALALIKEAHGTCAELIITRLEEQGFAVGEFK